MRSTVCWGRIPLLLPLALVLTGCASGMSTVNQRVLGEGRDLLVIQGSSAISVDAPTTEIWRREAVPELGEAAVGAAAGALREALVGVNVVVTDRAPTQEGEEGWQALDGSVVAVVQVYGLYEPQGDGSGRYQLSVNTVIRLLEVQGGISRNAGRVGDGSAEPLGDPFSLSGEPTPAHLKEVFPPQQVIPALTRQATARGVELGRRIVSGG